MNGREEKNQVDESPIYARFLAYSTEAPNAVAIEEGDQSWTYAEVAYFCRRLAEELIPYGTKENKVVAIYGKREASLVVSMLASSMAGFTFAVLDSSYPSEKLINLAHVIEPSVILGNVRDEKELKENFAPLSGVPFYLFNLQKLSPPRRKIEEIPVLTSPMPPSRIAYFLFTSGTTGEPKCIQTSHRPLVHFISFYEKTFLPQRGDRFSMFSGLSHDPLLRDIFVPLSIGGVVCIPENEFIKKQINIYEWMQASEISYLHATPQLLTLIFAGSRGRKKLNSLKFAFSGGDLLRKAHVKNLESIAPHCQLVNFYGTTETPQAMGYYLVKRDEASNVFPIGRGISDVELLVLKEDFTPAGVCELGQIAVKTEYLSEGYLKDPLATAEKFKEVQMDSPCKIYFTGDYGCYLNDERIITLKGRLDDQVKIRGFRVELGEIVHEIEELDEVQLAVVLTVPASNGENVLVAFFIPKDTPPEDPTEWIKAALQGRLDTYKIPPISFCLPEMPLLPNGKIDRKMLRSKVAIDDVDDKQDEELREFIEEDVETRLVNEWKNILMHSKIDVTKSFVQLGGDSLSYIAASLIVEEVLGWLPSGWEKMPLKELAKQKQAGHYLSYQIGSTIIVRALSIVLVVFDHFNVVHIVGMNTALFMAAGWSIGRYQLGVIVERNSVMPLLTTMMKIIAPVLIATFLLNFRHSSFEWSSLFLVGNFLDPKYEDIASMRYWFINILIQIFLIFSVLFSFEKIRRLAAKDFYRFGLLATLISLAIGAGIYSIWNTDYLLNRLPHLKWSFVFLGMAIPFANSMQQKMILVLVAASFVALGEYSAQFAFLDYFTWVAFAATLFMLFVKEVKSPIFLAKVINYIAISSLFIYISHFSLAQFFSDTVHRFMKLIGIHAEFKIIDTPLVLSIVAIAGGVLVWKLWSDFCDLCLAASSKFAQFKRFIQLKGLQRNRLCDWASRKLLRLHDRK